MKIYTRRGDLGETGTLGPERIPKDNIRLAGCGDVDELNANIGVVLTSNVAPEVAEILKRVQHELFVIGAALATTADAPKSSSPGITLEHVGRLEVDIDRLSNNLDDLTEFILPGGDPCAAQIHVARTVCRRAERSVVTLSHTSDVPPACMGYLNRLSDLLFVMARFQNRHRGKPDIPWQK